MAKYQQYDDYKELQSIFVEKIPMHWNIEPLYALCGFKQGKAHEPFIDDDGEFICVNARFVSTQGQGNSIKRCSVNLTPAKLYDILMVMSDLPNGRALARAFYVEELKNNYAVNQRVCAITAKKVHAKFLYYQLNRSPYFLMFNDGSNQTHLSNDAYKKYPVLLPSTIEQVQIANFLDYETAQIDTLIDKQQTLIQLLKEKRQAVISHAVTKGLNPDAPMKDSGVEWLGEVPEHWEVGRYKFCTSRIVVGIAEAATHAYAETGVPILRSTNIKEEGLDTSGMLFIKKEFAESNSSKYLYENDIITVRTGYPGTSAVIPEALDKSQCFTNLIATPKESMLSIFLSEYLNSHTGKAYFDLLGWGSAQKNISVPILQNIPIAWPDKTEQARIVSYLQQQRERYTKLVSKGEKQVELLKERRTALISAAVTGKIDVRGWVAPE